MAESWPAPGTQTISDRQEWASQAKQPNLSLFIAHSESSNLQSRKPTNTVFVVHPSSHFSQIQPNSGNQ